MATPEELTALYNEVVTDPQAIGYSVVMDGPVPDMAKAAQGSTLNAVVDEINTPRAEIVPRVAALQNDIMQAIAPADFDALLADEAAKLNTLITLASSGVDMNDSTNQALVDAALPAVKYGASNAAVKALGMRNDGSRAEVVLGRKVSRLELAMALYGDAR